MKKTETHNDQPAALTAREKYQLIADKAAVIELHPDRAGVHVMGTVDGRPLTVRVTF